MSFLVFLALPGGLGRRWHRDPPQRLIENGLILAALGLMSGIDEALALSLFSRCLAVGGRHRFSYFNPREAVL
jgi:hypothetical protein